MNTDIYTRFQNIEPLRSSSANGGSAGAWIFLIIFFGIIIALVIVAVIGSKKDEMEKLIENDKRKKIRNEVEIDRVQLFSSLNETVSALVKEVNDFKPSIGTKSLGDINREAIDKIKEIKNSRALNQIYQSPDYKTEIKPIIDELAKVKPSNWTKEATFAIGLIEAKFKSISSKKENTDLIKKGITREWK